jgi:hypothetical protein
MSSNAREARRLRPDRRKRSKDHDISNHKYTYWVEQALHIDTNVKRKRSKDHDLSNRKYTCWDEQALHLDTNVAIAYSVGTLTLKMGHPRGAELTNNTVAKQK